VNALRKFGRVTGAFLLGVAAAAALYVFVARPRYRTWGATGAEVVRIMPGDELVSNPNYLVTRAVTVKAPPERIWPWLVQMGRGRGGLYSYDWLDRWQGILDGPSAVRILPQFQDLKPGDRIPIGGGPGWPVRSMVPNRSLVLDIRDSGFHLSWSWELRPLNARASRLVLRIRGRLPLSPSSAPLLAVFEVSEFPMVRRMLDGIRDRVEGDPPTPSAELLELGTWALAAIIGLLAAVLAFFRRLWWRFFILAGLALLVVLFLAFRQPPLWAGAALDLILLAFLALSLHRSGRSKLI
jgi:hypothetical protein